MIQKFDKTIRLTPQGEGVGSALVEVSIPFAYGELTEPGNLSLVCDNKNPIGLQTKILNRWPDGSVKWLFCRGIASGIEAETVFSLQQGDGNELSLPMDVIQTDECIRVTTESTTFHFDRQILAPFLRVEKDGCLLPQGSRIELLDSDDRIWIPKIDTFEIAESGSVCTDLRIRGDFVNSGKKGLRFYARIEIIAQLEQVRFQFTVHNPKAAKHPDNLWDLGDPNSAMLKALTLNLDIGKAQTALHGIDHQSLSLADNDNIILYQESSGGENWDSPVHRNRHGDVPMKQKGWTLSCDNTLVDSGERCQPEIAVIPQNGDCYSVAIENFWQRFPKAYSIGRQTISLGLLPGEFPDHHELQGGEQNTETVLFNFGGSAGLSSHGSIDACCTTETLRSANVLSPALYTRVCPAYAKLVDIAHDPDVGFIAKREQLDEYGWRNFGDTYADHETAFHSGDSIFVSHYNNQYDLLASFYREYFLTGNIHWRELAVDLAAHVADIDINQTCEDREEYCLGPFWHTDHYLDAGLSTHRMASREHKQHKSADFCGGGPGAEMAYFSGLSMHYLQTGDERFRDLVIQLAEWNWLASNGIPRLGAVCLRAIKQIVRYRDGQKQGIVRARYPFTRGTGNCINSMLEALELTGDKKYLKHAERLIQQTVHPHDDPQQRNLLNAEVSWSYTVFLMVLGRYVAIKEQRKELDDSYSYAVNCLVLYAEWMAENEYFYLEKPEILEYPNDTWAAQEHRKSVVLFYAAKYVDLQKRAVFIKRALEFVTYVEKTLSASETAYYTRIQALLLQNSWVANALIQVEPVAPVLPMRESDFPRPSILSYGGIVKMFLGDLVRAIKHFNLNREIMWFKFRFK